MYLAEDKLKDIKENLSMAMQRNDMDSFIKIFSAARAEKNVNAEILTMAAACYGEIDLAAARSFCAEAIKLDGNFVLAQIINVRLLLKAAAYDEVIAKAERLLADSWIDLSEAYRKELDTYLTAAYEKSGREKELSKENLNGLTEQELYRLAAENYNSGHVKKAWLYLKPLLQLKRAGYYFLAGLLCYRYALSAEEYEGALDYFCESERLGSEGLTENDEMKRQEIMQVLYWQIGDAKAAYRHGMRAYELARSAPKKRFNLSTTLFTANHLDDLSDEALFRLHTLYEKNLSDIQPFKARFKSHDKIRIGYLSPDFRRHAVGHFIMGLMKNYSSDIFSVYCYSKVKRPDVITKDIEKSVDVWRDIVKLSAKEAAQVIYDDEIDILIELAGHTADNGLEILAWRPAPVQMCGIGYVNTTGMAAVDYFISDKYCTQQAQERLFVEKPLKLEHTHFCYTAAAEFPECSHAVRQKGEPITFGCFNKAKKITPAILRAWKKILDKLPAAKLLLKAQEYGYKKGKALMREKLAAAGINLEQVIIETASRDYMARYNEVDIALDTYPCGGGTTTFEALYMGAPVITLVGKRHVARFGYSILKNLRHAEWTSQDEDEYADKAVNLALDCDKLNYCHAHLREEMINSPLMDNAGYAADIEEKLTAVYMERNKRAKRNFAAKCGQRKRKERNAEAAMQSSVMEQIRERVRRMEGLFSQNNYRGALAECRILQESLPKNADKKYKADILLKESMAYKEMGEPVKAAEKAMQAFETAGEDKKAAGMYYRTLLIALHCTRYDFTEMLHYHKIYEDIQPKAKAFTKWQKNDTGKIRIGYISSDFRQHVMLNFYMAFLRSYDKANFTVTCYMVSKGDEYTEGLKGYADEWRDLSSYSTSEAAEIIHNDGQDILVDLTGFSGEYAIDILKWRPSPIQLSGLGYIDFIDLSYIDYCLGDAPTARNLPDEYRKKCIEMPSGLFCYTPYQTAEIDARCAWEKGGFITFGSFNNIAKMNDEVLALWGEILRRVPNSSLLLKANAFYNREFAEMYRAKLKKFGIIRAQLRPTSAEYLSEYNDMDIALDTFPWNGGGTTCDALYMGTPVIALEGKAFGDNYAASILKAAGLNELVAKNEAEYIELAVELAKDKTALKSLQQNLRTIVEKSPLMNEKLYVKNMEQIYRRLCGKKRD